MMRLVKTIMVVILLAAAASGSWIAVARLGTVGRLEREVAALNGQMSKVNNTIRSIRLLNGDSVAASSDESSPPAEGLDLRTSVDMDTAIRKLGDAANATQIAECLAEVDSWNVRPEDEKSAMEMKQRLVARLRQQVKKQVTALQQIALNSSTGSEAIKRYQEAGQLLALYPMSDEKAVIDEAKDLAARQADIPSRIDLLRRQRYNQWATTQIESAIAGYNKGSSYWSPKKENAALMESLVQSLGEVDPSLLEPAVTELYEYVLDLTKGSISEHQKVDLAKRLTSPSIRRKTLGDF